MRYSESLCHTRHVLSFDAAPCQFPMFAGKTTCHKCITLVVNGAAKYFLRVSLQGLQAASCLCTPHAARMIVRSRYHLSALRHPTDLGDLLLVSLHRRIDSQCPHIEDVCCPVRRSSCKSCSRSVKCDIQHMIGVSAAAIENTPARVRESVTNLNTLTVCPDPTSQSRAV